MEVHPEMAYRLNQVLAYMHPNAIPNEFRTPHKKKSKEFELQYDLLGFDVVHQLRELRLEKCGMKAWGSDLSTRTQTTLEYIGGVNSKGGNWEFDYNVKPVIAEICRSGMLPEQKSHQYYPSPNIFSDEVIRMAEIKEYDTCLEPSAGVGGIADKMPNDRTVCVEISVLHCDILKAKGFDVVNEDFILWASKTNRRFSLVAMNPPFNGGRWMSHLKSASDLLLESGRIVAVLPSSAKGKTILQGFSHEWSEVIQNAFDGTGISVVILLAKKEII
jgi:predicted RNA methylase